MTLIKGLFCVPTMGVAAGVQFEYQNFRRADEATGAGRGSSTAAVGVQWSGGFA